MALRVLGVALLVPQVSALESTLLPVPLRLLLVALWLVAVVRPHIALVMLAACVPFGWILLVALDVAPVRFTEALVLATLSGALIAAGRQRLTTLEPQRPTMAAPALLFGAVVICSAAVMIAVTQVGTRTPWLFVRNFGPFLVRDFLVSPLGPFAGVADAAWLIEGIGLLFVVARHSRDGVMRPIDLVRATVVGGVTAAVLAIGRQIDDAYAAAPSVAAMIGHVVKNRTSVHVSDVNAAGSYFAMTGLVALAMTIWRTEGVAAPESQMRKNMPWAGASMLLFAALWVTGSRTAVLAFVGVVALVAFTIHPFTPRSWRSGRALVIGVPIAIAIGALLIALDPRPEGSRTMLSIVRSRAAFIETGMHMIATAPWFGVGIGRYYEMSGQFMPQSIYWFFFHENAHNNFLQIAGELGVIGLAAFLWLLVAAARRLLAGWKANPGDRLLIGSAAALTAFIVTWSTGHPMLVPEVAYPFWILLGAAIARADGDAQPSPAGRVRVVSPRPVFPGAVRVLTALGIVVLMASVTPRARREAANLNLADASFGFYDWEGLEIDRFRWSGRQAAFFIPGTARELRVPVRALRLGRLTQPTTVSIAIEGRTLHRVWLTDEGWTTIHVLLPRGAVPAQFRRVDLITSPAWSLAALVGGRTDVRILGIEVGNPTTQ